jgi:hypothetical protein
LDTLIRDLNNQDYNTRKRAARELRHIGEPAISALTRSNDPIARFDSLAPQLAREIKEKALNPELFRAVRLIELLERLDTPDAPKFLNELESGAAGAYLTRIAESAAIRVKSRKPAPPLPDDPAALWDELGSSDASRAFQSSLALAAKPAESIPLLREKLLSSPCRDGLDTARVAGLIASLDADDFTVREAASRELASYGKAAEKAMKAVVNTTKSPEAQRRLTELLKAPADPARTAVAIHAKRAMETLEMIGTSDARTVLEDASRGAKTEWFQKFTATVAARIPK